MIKSKLKVKKMKKKKKKRKITKKINHNIKIMKMKNN
jgi:hypothetical protein